MSYITTAPETNPTSITQNPTQIMQVKPAVQVKDFANDNIESIKEEKTFSITQLDWVKLAAKNKVVDNLTWVVGAADLVYSRDINLAFLSTLIPVGKDFNSFTNMHRIMFSFKLTFNANYAGKLAVIWNPSPFPDYLAVHFGFDLDDLRVINLLQKVWLSPDNSEEVNIMIPVIFPWNYFKWGSKTPLSLSAVLSTLSDNYNFGTLSTKVFSPLVSNSPVTSLRISVSAQIMDLSTAGLAIATNPV
jgi:hypothetical protein